MIRAGAADGSRRPGPGAPVATGLACILLALTLAPPSSHAARRTPAPDDAPLGPSTESRVRAVPSGPNDAILHAGSRSIGACGDGYLADGAALPPQGTAYRVLASFVPRQLSWGTDELVAAIPRVAAKVRSAHPGAVLSVGNLGGRYGGPIRYSRSHQAGRDVDLGFYMTDADSRPAHFDGLVRFRCNGTSRDADGAFLFDVARNWALIAALVEDQEIEVEQVFIVPCLRRKLLDYAAAVRADAETRRRAGLLLSAAGQGSYSHDDHFHVRIACSYDDLLAGCRNSRRARGWMRVHEERLLDEVAAARRGLRAECPADRLAALAEVVRLDAKSLGPLVARLVDDPDSGVRRAAHTTLRAIAARSALPRLRRRVPETRDVAQLLQILETFAAFQRPSPKTEAILLRLLRDPRLVLHRRLSAEDTLATRVAAARALRLLGRKGALRTLIGLLATPNDTLREAVSETLPYVANRPLGRRDGESPEELRRRWLGWWERVREWPSWRIIRQGFRDAGISVSRSLWRWDAVRPLFDAIAGGGPASWHAQELLRHFAKENAPRIPQNHPERALPLWHAWLGSRLPVGAVDDQRSAQE